MRVLIAHNFYRRQGGEDSYVRGLIDLMRSEDHEVHLIGPSSSDAGELKASLSMLTLGKTNSGQLDEVVDFRPDVIHVHNVYPLIGASGLRRLAAHAPVVMTLHNYRLRCPNGLFFTHGHDCRLCTRWGTAPAAILNCLGSRRQSIAYAIGLGAERSLGPLEEDVSRFVAPSRMLKRTLVKYGLPAQKVVHLPYFHPGPVRERTDAGTHALFVGRLDPEKGADVFLEAASIAGLPAAVIGDGPEAESLQAAAGERVEFTGWLSPEDVSSWLHKARILVIPSLWLENFPMVFLSALAHGVPVVASEGISLGEYVHSWGVGRTFKTGEARSLAQTLKELWEDLTVLAEMGSKGRDLVAGELSPGSHLRQLVDVYEEAAGGR